MCSRYSLEGAEVSSITLSVVVVVGVVVERR